jgi:hypothetical protein
MNKICVVVVLSVVAHTVAAQVDAVRFQNIVSNMNSGSAGYSAGFKGRYNADGEIKGNIYLDSAFRETDIHLYKTDATLESPSRYNLLHNEFEVETTAGLRSLSGSVVEYFKTGSTLGDSTKYVNGKDYKLDGVILEGFLAVLADGEARLYKQIKIEIVKPSYNPNFEVGDRNTNIVQKPIYYAATNGNDLVRIRNFKNLSETFGKQKEVVSRFIKDNKKDLKNEQDLASVFNYYNSLQ